jgi:creatinine amidohydrolase/Fe(II)-dependent formamide hydrolase-like protein
MRYELLFPHQLREAIAKNTPVVLPLGVLEYHGEHLVNGVDTLVITKALDLLEKEQDLILLPPFFYGASSYAVEAPEGNGSVHVPSEILNPFAKSLFDNLLRIGFRNIHVFIHHQSENFTAGMPTDLSFKLAARQATFAFLEKQRGEGWWGRSDSADYYESHSQGDNPFNWIRIHPFLSEKIQQQHPIDHAGKLETALMMALCPEGVDLQRISHEKWYTQTAREATLEYGNTVKNVVLENLREILFNQAT